MARYTLNQTYSCPRDLTDAERRALAATVEHAALTYLRDLAALALLHDAAEAYIVDVPQPIKPHLGGYRDIEHAVERAVFGRFGLLPVCHGEWSAVKAADDAVLAAERDQVMGVAPHPWAPLPEPPDGLTIAMLPPSAARALFLARAREVLNLYVGECPDAPPDPLLRRLNELQAALEIAVADRDAAINTIRDARFVLASAFQDGQKPIGCAQLRDVARRTFQVLRRIP